MGTQARAKRLEETCAGGNVIRPRHSERFSRDDDIAARRSRAKLIGRLRAQEAAKYSFGFLAGRVFMGTGIMGVT